MPSQPTAAEGAAAIAIDRPFDRAAFDLPALIADVEEEILALVRDRDPSDQALAGHV